VWSQVFGFGMEKRAEGKSNKEAFHCLKRHLIRVVFRVPTGAGGAGGLSLSFLRGRSPEAPSSLRGVLDIGATLRIRAWAARC
jgi:hypothetical protein